MKNGFRASMAVLHTWRGLLGGWILFAVFLTGTASYFRQEISDWMRPELRPGAQREQAVVQAVDYLAQRAPDARTWLIEPPDGRVRSLRVGWSQREGLGGFTLATLDASGRESAPVRKTMGGDFFYYFHFDLIIIPFRLGRWLVCLCAMGMLVAIITGVVIHRRIFADFFTFRPRAQAQRAWLDGHNMLGVLALPYHLMITYTGLVTFALMLLPYGATMVFGAVQPFQEMLYGMAAPPPRAGVAAQLVPVAPLLRHAQEMWGGGVPGRISVFNPGDASSRIMFARGESDRVTYTRQTLVFSGMDGRLLGQQEGDGPVERVWGTLYGLHLGRFAGAGLRALFALSGLVGTGMVATGLLLWVAKRRDGGGRGVRVAERLNVGTIAGLPVAMISFLLANRLLPPFLPGRERWEIWAFFGVWGAMLLYTAFRRPMRAWRELFGLAAVAAAAVPVVNAWTTEAGLAATLRDGDWAVAGIDLAMLGFVPALVFLAWIAGRPPQTRKRRGRSPALAEDGV